VVLFSRCYENVVATLTQGNFLLNGGDLFRREPRSVYPKWQPTEERTQAIQLQSGDKIYNLFYPRARLTRICYLSH